MEMRNLAITLLLQSEASLKNLEIFYATSGTAANCKINPIANNNKPNLDNHIFLLIFGVICIST